VKGSSDSEQKEAPPGTLPRKRAKERRHPGYRYVHVLVPERTYNHVKAQACLSGMEWREYLVKFLEEAWPYPGPSSPLTQEQAPAQ